MIIYPVIELMGGRCVSLRGGRIDDPLVWDVDPIEAVRGFAAAGARWVHVTDFDAMSGDDRNAEIVREIILRSELSVQLAGGIRTQAQAEAALEMGASRVVLGTGAAWYPDLLREMAKYHPDQIVLSVDVLKGKAMVDGWRQTCAITPEALIEAFADAPLAAVKITDIEGDTDWSEAPMGVIAGLATHARAPVIASGVVRSIDDISRLKYIPNIEGALVGRALVRGTVDLAEAITMAEATPEPLAEFI